MTRRPVEWRGLVVRLSGGSCRCCNKPSPKRPTEFGPGTVGKIRVMAARESRGECLWHPGDAKTQRDDGACLTTPTAGPVDLLDWFAGEVRGLG